MFLDFSLYAGTVPVGINITKGIVIMSSTPSLVLESVSRFMAVRRYSKRTIEAYLYWIKYFIIFHKKRHPSEMSVPKISLAHLREINYEELKALVCENLLSKKFK